MANINEIKTHIKHIRDTEKVTHAMYLISSAKYRKAKEKTYSFLPYFNELEKQVKAISYSISPEKCPYVTSGDGEGACLIITSDKGLAGDYNRGVLKLASDYLSKNKNAVIYVTGEVGKKHFDSSGVKYNTVDGLKELKPDENCAQILYSFFSELFLSGKISFLDVIYYGTKNGIRCNPEISRLFPITVSESSEYERDRFEYIPDEDTVINKIIPLYIDSLFYSIVIQSYYSEQFARMTAMDSATENAGEMLEKLNLEYNHMRQNAITQEISEISGERIPK